MGMAIEMRMTIMVTTTIISTNVKPLCLRLVASPRGNTRRAGNAPSGSRRGSGRRTWAMGNAPSRSRLGSERRTWAMGCAPSRSRLGSGRLPLCIGGSIGCLLLALGEYLEYRLAAPTLGFGVVLGAVHSPFEFVGEGIAGNAAQEFQLGAVGVLRE